MIVEACFDTAEEAVAFLAACRVARMMTMTEVAEETGMTKSWVSMLECGAVPKVPFTQLVKLAKLHGLKFALVPDKPELYG